MLIFSIIAYAAIFALSMLIKPKTKIEDAKPAGLGEFSFPTTTEGRRIPIFFGKVKLKGPNVVWFGDFKQTAMTERVGTGIFSSKRVITGYKYSMGVQYALARTEDNAVLSGIWIGDTRVYAGSLTHGQVAYINMPLLFGGDDLGSGGVIGSLQFFDGRATQPASSYLSTYQLQGGDTPAYRGTMYMAPFTASMYLGNSPAIKPFSFEFAGYPNEIGLLGDKHIINTGDANPACVVYKLLTNKEWGFKYDPDDIDLDSFVDAGNTLYTEGNGFCMILENSMEAKDFLELLEEQIDGIVFQNQVTGKYQINLARLDYTPGTLREISDGKVKNFTRGSWDDTVNEVRIPFIDRDDYYKDTYGLAQDMANAHIQDGTIVTASKNFPGIKDATLANIIAWRELRGLSYPFAKGTLEVDRSYYDVQPVQALEFTDSDLGLTRMPIRITRVDLGELADNKIVLDFVQDIYAFEQGSFADPPPTGWEPPEDNLLPFESDEQVCFEAPRAFVYRNPEGTGMIDLLWAAARAKSVEVGFKIAERHSSGTPSGDFETVAECYVLMFIGTLEADLDAGGTIPLSSLLITASPDSQLEIKSAIVDLSDPNQLGTDLTNLIMINDELILVQSAENSGGDIQLNDVYRAALDTVQANHSLGDSVYLLSSGGNISETSIPAGQNVDVELRPFSITDEVATGVPTVIQLTMINRIRRPYPPSYIKLNTVVWDDTNVSLEGTGSGGEDYGIDLDVNRRDFRIADGLNEVAAISSDAATSFSDFPSAHSTEHDIEVRNDPDGSDVLLFSETLSGTPTSISLLRLKILKETDGVLPAKMRLVITASHTYESTSYDAIQSLIWDFTIATGLSGQFNYGALDTNDISNIYTVDAAGVHNFTLSSSFTAGDVEYRINSGSWVQLVAAGNTTGATTSLSVSDTLEIRHLSSDTLALKQLDMTAPGAGTDAYAILFA